MPLHNFLSPLRGWLGLLYFSHGLRRGLESGAPPGLNRISYTATLEMSSAHKRPPAQEPVHQ